MSELTPWFPPDVKPLADRVGPYETDLLDEEGHSYSKGFSRWTGEQWMDTCESAQEANATSLIGYQDKHWRGLSSDPSGKGE